MQIKTKVIYKLNTHSLYVIWTLAGLCLNTKALFTGLVLTSYNFIKYISVEMNRFNDSSSIYIYIYISNTNMMVTQNTTYEIRR